MVNVNTQVPENDGMAEITQKGGAGDALGEGRFNVEPVMRRQ